MGGWELSQPGSQPISSPMTLPIGRVDMWYADIDAERGNDTMLRKILSSDERERAERYVFELDRQRFVKRRFLLRVLLAAYLQCSPASIVFDHGQWSQPTVRSTRALRFSLSQSGNLVLYALTIGRSVGVDVEAVRELVDVMALGGDVLTSSELAALASTPASQRTRHFLVMWTRKEAVLKACGVGLGGDPRALEVGTHGRIVRRGARRWHLETFEPVQDYVATIAVGGTTRKAQLMGWL